MTTGIDDRGFGQAVSTYRGWQNLSQRGLAERLNEMGVSLDASALSRIEQGKRSIRLTEALAIAEALETDISTLLDVSPDPRAQFATARRVANEAMRSAAMSLAEMIDSFLTVMDLADDNPDVAASLTDDELGNPDLDAGGYESWVLQRLEKTLPFVRVTSRQQAERAEAIVRAFTERIWALGSQSASALGDDDEEDAG